MLNKAWAYDFQSFLTLASMVYSFAAGVPAALWFGMRQFNAKFKLITAVCLYGYSLLAFIPAAVVCVFPSQLFPFPFSWFMFLSAGVVSTLFLLRNIAPIVVEHTAQHAVLILGVLGIVQFIFTITLKFNFSALELQTEK